MTPGCLICGIKGRAHRDSTECLSILRSRYELAQHSLMAMHKRYRSLETRLERIQMQERAARTQAKRAQTIESRVSRLEAYFEGKRSA